MVEMQNTSFSFKVCGCNKISLDWEDGGVFIPNSSNCSSHPIPDSPRRSTLHPAAHYKSQFTAFSTDTFNSFLVAIWKKRKKKRKKEGEFQSICNHPKKINKHQYTWRNKKTEISIATCFLITHQVTRHKPRYMSNLGSCIFWHAFAKSIFNIYLAKRLRITWDGWDRWEVWKEQKIERTSGMLNCITIVLILKLCVLLRSPAI